MLRSAPAQKSTLEGPSSGASRSPSVSSRHPRSGASEPPEAPAPFPGLRVRPGEVREVRGGLDGDRGRVEE
eukprot:9174482-Alexandrium_andersonii.AAC.1